MLGNEGVAPALFLNGLTCENEGCAFMYTDGASEVCQD
jgi:hypothetical protein